MELKFPKIPFVVIVVISIGKTGIVEEDSVNAMKNREDGVMIFLKNIRTVLSGNQRSQKNNMTKKEEELDRIIDLGEEILDLDFYKWLICYLHSKNSIRRLKKCTKENWEKDKLVWKKHQSTRFLLDENGEMVDL